MKKALITGVSGQDGSYLAPILLDKGYEVHAIVRCSSNDPTVRLKDLFSGRKVHFHYGNLQDLNRITDIMQKVEPDYIYNLAAQSHVGISFKCPNETWDVDYYGVGRVVNEALKVNPQVKIYQASTSEMFGNSPAPQNEDTPFDPQSPYAEAKLRAYEDFVVSIRENRGAFLTTGFLFNHESPRRGKHFVTRKITYSLAKIAAGKQDVLELGNLNSVRDWGHAKDYVHAMTLILENNSPNDYVVSSDSAHSVRDFVNIAASHFGFDIEWSGEEEKEVGVNKKTGKTIVRVNPEFYRPAEVNYLLGDSSKIRSKLGWKPEYSFEQLVKEMSEEDMQLVEREG